MRIKIKHLGLIILALIITGVFAGCGKSSDVATDFGNADKGTQSQTENSAPEGKSEANTDPFGKYDEPITVSSVKNLGIAPLEFPEGDSLENNAWTRYYKDTFNIEINWLWSTLETQYDQKVNIAITSGDIPDVMMLRNAAQLKMMYENEQLYALDEVLDKYGAPFTKEVLNSDGGLGLESASFDGKLYAIPHIESGLMSSPVLWVRTDWLEKYNLEVPTTKEEFLHVAEVFSQNGAYGLGVQKDLFETGYAGLEGFFNMFGAYHDTWFEKDGGLVYGDVQPEVKEALETLQMMYEKGWIDPEFGVKDNDKVNEDVNSGKIGMMFGSFWNAVMFNPSKVDDPSIEWMPVAIPEVLSGNGGGKGPSSLWHKVLVCGQRGLQKP